MKQDNPFAKLGALDQKLYRDTAPKLQSKEAPNHRARMSEATHDASGLPANPQTRKPANHPLSLASPEKPEKYTTRLEPSLIKKIRLHSVEKDMKDYEVVRTALTDYFKRNP